MSFRVPHLCSKILKIYNWSMDSGVHSVCFRGVSPLRQCLDSYAKSHLKMCHTFKHFIHMQFCCWLILLSSLNIELALVCWTNPDDVHCFRTIFRNLIFVFASICAARPVHIQSNQYRSCSTVKQRRAVSAIHPDGMGATKNSAVSLSSWNDMISIHQRSARTNECKTTLI